MSPNSHVVDAPTGPALSLDDYRLLVDSVVDYAIFLLDVGGHVTTWNQGAEKIKGYAAGEIIGQHFSKFYPPEDIAAGKPRRELEIASKEGRVEDEGWRLRKDGTRFWASVVITALRDEAGSLRGFAKVTRDLTARHEAEEKNRQLLQERTAREVAEEGERRLLESEARYRALSARLEVVLEGVADGITLEDRRGRIVFANGAAARFSGFDSGAAMMQTPLAEIAARYEMFDPDGKPLEADDLPARRVLSGEKAASARIHVRERSTRRDWWVQLRACPVLDAEGKPELAVNIWHDVTADHLREIHARCLADATAALGTSLEYEEMLSTLGGIMVPGLADWCSIYLLEGGRLRDITTTHTDPGKLDRVNEYRRRYPPDPNRAPGLWNVLRTGTVEVFNDITEEMLARSSRSPEALAALRSLGLRAVLLVPIRVPHRILGVIALVSDETERRYDGGEVALAEELGRRVGIALEHAQLYQRAQEAARTAEHAASAAEEASRIKDEFLATVSHELRTPLSAVLGWATLLKDRVTDPSAKRPIEVIHRNAQAQVKIIDDILDVSRVITGKLRIDPRASDLVAISWDAIEVVRPSADAKKIKLEFEPDSDSCLLVADPERLQQVVWNLLSNAVKFTEPGGKVRLFVGKKASQVVLEVSDTGKGIEPAFLPLVFERFRQADSSTTRRVGGLGLGLALVRHIVELHGGRATAASGGIDKGATFTITLPLRAVIPAASGPRRSSPPSSAPESRAPIALSGVKVLIVDDEPDARDLVAAVLAEAGAQVETSPSAAEAFEAFQRFQPDVLVSDIGMPDEDGYSFMRRIRGLTTAQGGGVGSLALTAFAREEDRVRAISAGYTTHLGKPASPDALASAVANLASVRQRV